MVQTEIEIKSVSQSYFPYRCEHKMLQVHLLLARQRLPNRLPMLRKLSQSMLWVLSLQILCHQHHPLMFLPSNSDRSTSALLQLMFLPRPVLQNMQLGLNFIKWVSNMCGRLKYQDSKQDCDILFSQPRQCLPSQLGTNQIQIIFSHLCFSHCAPKNKMFMTIVMHELSKSMPKLNQPRTTRPMRATLRKK